MDCRHVEDLLSPYLENELSPRDRALVERHFEHCPQCAGLFSLLQETTRALEDFPEILVSPELKTRLVQIPEKKKDVRIGFSFNWRPLFQPMLAAASVFFILLSCYLFNPDKTVIDKAINRQLHRGYGKIGQIYTKVESAADSLENKKDSLLVSLKNMNIFKRNGN